MQVMIVGLFGCVIASLLLTACTRLSGENDTASLETSVEAATPQSEIDKAHQTHTNVVLILIDDLSHYGVTAYGANRLHSYDGEFTKEEFATESIDALAQQGIRIDRAFAYPICENTRIALMSGKRNDRNYLQPKSQHSSDITFGDAFKKACFFKGIAKGYIRAMLRFWLKIISVVSFATHQGNSRVFTDWISKGSIYSYTLLC